VQRDLADGQHRNPEAHPGWFTTAYLHRPQELADELSEAGFDTEGPSEPSVIGATGHLLAFGRRPAP
jgi:hypothetical protein